MVVCDFADAVPKWCLQGRSALETGECLCDRNAWIAPENKVYPQPLDSDFPVGFAIPHVAPNDPCPCGSGLRYCRCHGKYLS